MTAGDSSRLPGSGAARTLCAFVLCVGTLPGISGCSALSHSPGPCLPPKYTLDSTLVAPGGTLRVSAPDATCNPRYGEDAKVRIDLVNERQEVLLSEISPMSDAGAFTHTLAIPDALRPGTYDISATPDGVDWCDDTGQNNRLENPGFESTGMAVVRASCGIPYVHLRVTG